MTVLSKSLFCLSVGLFLIRASRGDEPEKKAPSPRDHIKVAAAIDRDVERRLADEKVPASPAADDAEFCRRVHLDIIGRIPSAAQTAAFLDSKAPDKRAKLIDELLASSEYGRHFGIIWSDLIVKRDDTNRGLNTTAFKKWLADSFNEGRGWDQIVRDLLTAEGASNEKPTTVFFMANRDMNAVAPPKIVGTTANLFMGIQLQCAQCHNHPFIREWKQTDFWGVAAFFGQTRATGAQQNMPNAPITISESSASGEGGRRPGFGSRGGSAGPGSIVIPDGADPRRPSGKVVKAKFFLADEPKLAAKAPYRPTFADWLTAKENKFFAPATVNRLWAHFFARGFVNPVDDMSDDSTPSHPELLQLLSEEFKESGFDLKHLIRSVCNSKAYQRTSKPLKENEQDIQLFSHMSMKVMSPEVLYDSLCAALGTTELRSSSGGGRGGFGGGRGGAGGGREAFVNFFTTKEEGDDATEFALGIPQFLRLMNSQTFNEPGPALTKLMRDGGGTDKIVETLFLSTLSRRPTEAEATKMAAYIAKKKESKEGYVGVLWVLINSAEFVCIR